MQTQRYASTDGRLLARRTGPMRITDTQRCSVCRRNFAVEGERAASAARSFVCRDCVDAFSILATPGDGHSATDAVPSGSQIEPMSSSLDHPLEVRSLMAERDGVEPPVTRLARPCRRLHVRVPGPFDGRRVGALETPVKLFDLSCGGAFVNSLHEQQDGASLVLTIELPFEGRIAVEAEALYSRAGFGFAVRFVDVTPATATRLDRALRMLQASAQLAE